MVYYYTDEKGEKHQKWETCQDHAEAKRRKAEIENQQGNGTFIPPQELTVKDFLREDVEDFIKTHMKAWECDRLTVEFQVTKVVAEIFSEQKSQETEKTPTYPIPRKKLSKRRQIFSSIRTSARYLFYIRVLFAARKTISNGN